jgi:hypothetical protein
MTAAIISSNCVPQDGSLARYYGRDRNFNCAAGRRSRCRRNLNSRDRAIARKMIQKRIAPPLGAVGVARLKFASLDGSPLFCLRSGAKLVTLTLVSGDIGCAINRVLRHLPCRRVQRNPRASSSQVEPSCAAYEAHCSR